MSFNFSVIRIQLKGFGFLVQARVLEGFYVFAMHKNEC